MAGYIKSKMAASCHLEKFSMAVSRGLHTIHFMLRFYSNVFRAPISYSVHPSRGHLCDSTFLVIHCVQKKNTHSHFLSYLRWPVKATVHKSFNYLWPRDNYLWPRLIISGPEILSLAQRKYLWARLRISGPEIIISGPDLLSLGQR